MTETATYFASIKAPNLIAKWVPLESSTLDGAKREATRLYIHGFDHHVIVLGVGMETVSGHAVRPVASRPMTGSWAEVSR